MQELERDAYSISEVSQRLGISELLVRKLITQGHLRRLKIGRRVLILKTELERFLESKAAA